jgi:hypothetical protein
VKEGLKSEGGVRESENIKLKRKKMRVVGQAFLVVNQTWVYLRFSSLAGFGFESDGSSSVGRGSVIFLGRVKLLQRS